MEATIQLHNACQTGDVDGVREALRDDTVDVNGDEGRIWRMACRFGGAHVVRCLLQHRGRHCVNVHAAYSSSYIPSPFAYSILEGDWDVFSILLHMGGPRRLRSSEISYDAAKAGGKTSRKKFLMTLYAYRLPTGKPCMDHVGLRSVTSRVTGERRLRAAAARAARRRVKLV